MYLVRYFHTIKENEMHIDNGSVTYKHTFDKSAYLSINAYFRHPQI